MKLNLKNSVEYYLPIYFVALLSCVCFIESTAQVQYSYDQAGNRTKRKLAIALIKNHNSTTDAAAVQTAAEVQKEQEQTMKIAMDKGISVYPNPTNDFINVTVSSATTDQKATAYLIDNKGNVLFSQQVNSVPFSFDMTKYESGIYLIKVVIGKEQLSYHVIKSN